MQDYLTEYWLGQGRRLAGRKIGLTSRAVQQQLWDEAFEASRRILAPKARAKGVYTDEDVFKMIS